MAVVLLTLDHVNLKTGAVAFHLRWFGADGAKDALYAMEAKDFMVEKENVWHVAAMKEFCRKKFFTYYVKQSPTVQKHIDKTTPNKSH
jgi:hypothetical protein